MTDHPKNPPAYMAAMLAGIFAAERDAAERAAIDAAPGGEAEAQLVTNLAHVALALGQTIGLLAVATIDGTQRAAINPNGRFFVQDFTSPACLLTEAEARQITEALEARNETRDIDDTQTPRGWKPYHYDRAALDLLNRQHHRTALTLARAMDYHSPHGLTDDEGGPDA